MHAGSPDYSRVPFHSTRLAERWGLVHPGEQLALYEASAGLVGSGAWAGTHFRYAWLLREAVKLRQVSCTLADHVRLVVNQQQMSASAS